MNWGLSAIGSANTLCALVVVDMKKINDVSSGVRTSAGGSEGARERGNEQLFRSIWLE